MNNLPPSIEAHRNEVLILTTSTGAGHDSVAIALRQAIRELAPEVCVRVFDPFSTGTSAGLLSPGRWYDTTVAHAPWLWGLFYRATNRAVSLRLGVAAGALLCGGRLRTAIQRDQPGVVVSVHPLCTRLAGRIVRTVPAAPPLHCIVTDLVTIHRCWASDAVEAFHVATSDAGDALRALGIPPERIQVTGLPVRADFVQMQQTPTPETTPRVLVLGSGRSSRRIERIVRTLVASPLAMRLIVVCGRSTRLKHRLTRAVGARATVLGWRDDIAALMRWSSIVVTKGGSVTLAEAMSQARPLLIDQVLPGQEEGNVSFLEQTGSGRYAPEIDTLVRAVATRPPARAIREAPLATWWGSSAKRVAGRILAARADQIAARCQPIRENDSARAGRVIDNPINGERIIIRQSAAETGGRLLAFDLFLPPGAHVPSRHAHPIQEERFSVITGRMRFRLGHRTILANPGDTVAIPAGTAHWFGNVGAGVAQARVEVRPALRMEEVFEAAASLGTMGHFFGTRQPRLSDLALFLLEFQQELAVPDVPAFLVKGFLAPFAWLGRRRSRDTRQGWAR